MKNSTTHMVKSEKRFLRRELINQALHYNHAMPQNKPLDYIKWFTRTEEIKSFGFMLKVYR